MNNNDIQLITEMKENCKTMTHSFARLERCIERLFYAVLGLIAVVGGADVASVLGVLQ